MTGASPARPGRKPGTPKTGGRKKGTPNKTTALLKDAILKAAENAGGPGGLVGYLTMQAAENPGPFMSLLGKVLPMQMTGPGDGPIQHEDVTRDADAFARRMASLAAGVDGAGDGEPDASGEGGA